MIDTIRRTDLVAPIEVHVAVIVEVTGLHGVLVRAWASKRLHTPGIRIVAEAAAVVVVIVVVQFVRPPVRNQKVQSAVAVHVGRGDIDGVVVVAGHMRAGHLRKEPGFLVPVEVHRVLRGAGIVAHIQIPVAVHIGVDGHAAARRPARA